MGLEVGFVCSDGWAVYDRSYDGFGVKVWRERIIVIVNHLYNLIEPYNFQMVVDCRGGCFRAQIGGVDLDRSREMASPDAVSHSCRVQCRSRSACCVSAPSLVTWNTSKSRTSRSTQVSGKLSGVQGRFWLLGQFSSEDLCNAGFSVQDEKPRLWFISIPQLGMLWGLGPSVVTACAGERWSARIWLLMRRRAVSGRACIMRGCSTMPVAKSRDSELTAASSKLLIQMHILSL